MAALIFSTWSLKSWRYIRTISIHNLPSLHTMNITRSDKKKDFPLKKQTISLRNYFRYRLREWSWTSCKYTGTSKKQTISLRNYFRCRLRKWSWTSCKYTCTSKKQTISLRNYFRCRQCKWSWASCKCTCTNRFCVACSGAGSRRHRSLHKCW